MVRYGTTRSLKQNVFAQTSYCGGRGGLQDEWWSYAVPYERPKPSLLPVEEALDLIGVSDQRTAVPNPAKNGGRAKMITRRDDGKAAALKEFLKKTPCIVVERHQRV